MWWDHVKLESMITPRNLKYVTRSIGIWLIMTLGISVLFSILCLLQKIIIFVFFIFRDSLLTEPIFSVSISPNSTQITKLVLHNNASNVYVIYLLWPVKCGKVEEFQNKSRCRKIYKKKNSLKAEDLLLCRKTWQVCRRPSSRSESFQ